MIVKIHPIQKDIQTQLVIIEKYQPVPCARKQLKTGEDDSGIGCEGCNA